MAQYRRKRSSRIHGWPSGWTHRSGRYLALTDVSWRNRVHSSGAVILQAGVRIKRDLYVDGGMQTSGSIGL